MFQIFENAWQKSELAWFYQDMQKAKHSIEKQHSGDPDYRDLGSLRWKCQKGTAARNRLQEKISALLPRHEINFAAYVEQHEPNELHCDSYGGPFGTTCIIPLLEHRGDTDQTLVFDHMSTEGTNKGAIVINLHRTAKNSSPRFTHTKTHRLEHCGYESVVDSLPLVGVFPYRQGDMVAFDKRLLHCSNNWTATAPARQHKDFIIVHTFSKV
jgi:hypothetical protein